MNIRLMILKLKLILIRNNEVAKSIKHTSGRKIRGDMKVGRMKQSETVSGINKKELFSIL